jgi:DNA-binding beta-propeller fold protein YncE
VHGFAIVRCVARAAAERGVARLVEEPAGGPYPDEVARLAAQYYHKQKTKGDPAGDITRMTKAGAAVAERAASAAAWAAAPGAAEADRRALERYLALIPTTIGQARVTDFTPEQVRKALPPLPRFRRGDVVPGRPEWRLSEWLGFTDGGEEWLATGAGSPTPGMIRFGTDPGKRERFVREAKVAAGIATDGGSNVVPVLDADSAAGVPWVMAEHVAGGDLADRAAPLRWLSGKDRVRETAGLVRDAATILGRLHKLRPPIAHGTLTAADFLFDPKAGQFRIGGFGRSTSKTAPTPKDDVAALGGILYQLLTDRPGVVPGPRAGIELKGDGVPDAVIRLIGESTDPDPVKRPADAAAFAARLGEALVGRHVPKKAAAAAPLPLPEPAFDLGPGPLATQARHRPAEEDEAEEPDTAGMWGIAVAVFGVLFVGGVLAVMASGGKKDRHHTDTADGTHTTHDSTQTHDSRPPTTPAKRIKPPTTGTTRPAEEKEPEGTPVTKPPDEPPPVEKKPVAIEPTVSPPPRRAAGLAFAVGYEGGKAPVNRVAVSPDGKKVAAAASDRTARVWDAETGMLLFAADKHLGPVRSVGFSPDGARIVTGCEDGNARLWDAKGQFLAMLERDSGRTVIGPAKETGLPGHKGAVRAAEFNKDGKSLVTGSDDKTARVWDSSSKCRAILKGHDGPVVAVGFSPDGKRVVTASEDGTARVWEAATGKQLAAFPGHGGPVHAAAFTPDGAKVVSCGDGSVWVWDAATGKPVVELAGHKGPVVSVAFSPDGAHILTSGADGSLAVWEAATGRRMILRGGLPAGSAVGVVRAGRFGAVGAGTDGAVGLWLLPEGWPPEANAGQ